MVSTFSYFHVQTLTKPDKKFIIFSHFHVKTLTTLCKMVSTLVQQWAKIIHGKKDFCGGDGYFGQKKLAEKVRKSRQNVNRDKSA